MENKFLFILTPPYCGSTLLHELLCTSSQVSANNSEGTREGQGLPQVRDIMFNHNRRWDESLDFDWNYIKEVWMTCWDPNVPILLEKSPPNIIRTQSIIKYFHPSFFFILYRNPYAHCESLMRREGYSVEKASEFAIRCLYYQKRNIDLLEHAFQLSYEELTDKPDLAVARMAAFLPELSDIRIKKEFGSHNFKNQKMGISNLNSEKINLLTSGILDRINSIFKMNSEIISFFSYEIIEAPEHYKE